MLLSMFPKSPRHTYIFKAISR